MQKHPSNQAALVEYVYPIGGNFDNEYLSKSASAKCYNMPALTQIDSKISSLSEIYTMTFSC